MTFEGRREAAPAGLGFTTDVPLVGGLMVSLAVQPPKVGCAGTSSDAGPSSVRRVASQPLIWTLGYRGGINSVEPRTSINIPPIREELMSDNLYAMSAQLTVGSRQDILPPAPQIWEARCMDSLDAYSGLSYTFKLFRRIFLVNEKIIVHRRTR